MCELVEPVSTTETNSAHVTTKDTPAEDPLFFRCSQAQRPPTLGPRRRPIDPAVALRLCSWVRNALQLGSDTPVALREWVSLDSRAAAHSVSVIAGNAGARVHFVIDKASEQIVEADLRAALASEG